MALRTGKNLYFKTGIDNKGLQSGVSEGKGILKSFASQVSSFDVFAGLGVSAGLAFGKAASHAKQFAQDLETAMKEVQTISNAVQQDYEGVTNQIVDLSKTVPDAADKLAKAYYQVVSAGYDGAAGMELLETASKAAVGGVSDTLTAADGFTTVLNAWKLEAEDVTKVSDIMFQTVKLGKTTFSEISQSISQVAGMASAGGISFEEISASIATLTKQGVPTAMAVTQIRQAIIGLSENLGDGWASTMTMQEGLQKLRDMAGGSDNKLKEMMGRIEGMNAVLMTTGVNAKGASDDLEAMKNSWGASNDAFLIMNESAQVKFLKFTNTISAHLLPLGNLLKDTLAGGAEAFAKALETGKVEQYAKMLAIATTGMVAYRTATAAASITKMQFLRAIVKAKQAVLALNVAMAANPVGLLVAGLAAASAALLLFRNRSLETSKETKEFFTNINKETIAIDGLFSVATKAAEGTDERKKAIERINGKYGDYLTNMLDEKSTLEDIKKAHDQAKEAAVSRIASSAKAAAMDEAIAASMQKQGNMQAELYKTIEKSMGGDAARLATENVGDLATKFNELQSEYDAFMKSGDDGSAKAKWKELQSEVRTFVDTFANGDEYNLVWDMSQSISIDKNALAKKQKEIDAFYAGFIQAAQAEAEKIVPEEDDNDKDPLEDLKENLEKAKVAYDEWEDYKKTSRASELQAEYQHYLDVGDTYKSYLLEQLKLYKGNSAEIALIVKGLADIEIGELERAKKEAEVLKQEMDDVWADLVDDMNNELAKATDKLNAKQTKALKKYHDDIKQGLVGIAQISAKYATPDENLKAQIKELDDHYKKARLPLDEEYYRLRERIIKDHNADEIKYYTQTANKIFSELSDMARGFDEELANTIEAVGSLANDVGSAVSSFVTGDYIGGALSVLKAIGSYLEAVIGEADKAAEKAEALERQAYSIAIAEERINRALEKQYQLLSKLNGAEWISGAKQTINQINETIGALESQMRRLTIGIDLPGNVSSTITLKPDGWVAADFERALDDYGDVISSESRAEIQDFLDQIGQLKRDAEDLQIEIQLETVGFSFDTLVNDVVSMFDQMEDGAIDFGKTFEEVMIKAVKNSFQNMIVEKVMKEFYESIYEALDSPVGRGERRNSIGNLSTGEFAELEELWTGLSERLSGQYEGLVDFMEQMGIDMSMGDSDANGGTQTTALSGAIKGVTEDTANILAGQMSAIRFNVLEQLNVAENQLSTLHEIAENTSHNYLLNNVYTELQQIRRSLA